MKPQTKTPDPSPAREKLITGRELIAALADEVTINLHTLAWWARTGHVPSHKIGPRTRLYRIGEVRKALGLDGGSAS